MKKTIAWLPCILIVVAILVGWYQLGLPFPGRSNTIPGARGLKINLTPTISALRTYASAQKVFKEANYSAMLDASKQNQYCQDLALLYSLKDKENRVIKLIPEEMARATSSSSLCNGY